MIVALALFAGVARAACPAPVTAAELASTVQSAVAAYGRADARGFVDGSDAALVELPCLAEPITRYGAADVHRLVGLRAFDDHDEVRALAAFGAARRGAPGYAFPDSVLPAEHPVRALYDGLIADELATPVPAPADSTLQFDGPSVERPDRTAVIVQRLDGTGAVVATAYLWPGDALPSWAIAEPEPAAHGPTPLTIGATLAGTGSLALYAAAWQARGAYFADDAPYADEVALRQRADQLSLASVGTAVVAAGLIGATLAVGGTF